MRILFDPDPAAGGGTPVVPVTVGVAPPATPAAPASTPTPAAMPLVQLTPEQYQRLVEADREVARIRAENDEKVRVAERKAAEALGEKEGVQSALNRREEDFGRERSGYLQDIRDTKAESALNAALAGFEFADATALEQVRAILAPRVVVEKDGNGKWVALDSQTRRPAADVLRDELAGAAFARFRKAPHQGGGGGGNGPSNPNAPATPTADEATAARRARMVAEKRLVQSGGGKPTGLLGRARLGQGSNN